MSDSVKTIRGEMLALREITIKTKDDIQKSQCNLLSLLRKSKRYTMITNHYRRTEKSMFLRINDIRDEIEILKYQCERTEKTINELIRQLPETKTDEMAKILTRYQRVKWE